jgi:hypothetical protein
MGYAHADAGIRDPDADTDGGPGATRRYHDRDHRYHEENDPTRISQGVHRCRSIN